MPIDKRFINRCKAYLKQFRATVEDQISFNEKALEILRKKMEISDYVDNNFINIINDNFHLKLQYHTTLREIVDKIASKNENLKKVVTYLQSIIDALSKDGLTKPCYRLPILLFNNIMLDRNMMLLFISGIKLNGTSNKDSLLLDSVERKLYYLEEAMSSFIGDDFSINPNYKMVFLELYHSYIKITLEDMLNKMNLREDDLSLVEVSTGTQNKVTFDDLLLNLDRLLLNYLSSEVLNPKKEPSKQLSTVSNTKHNKAIDPLEEYISNGKVIKSCDIKLFEELLKKSGLSVPLQQEYLRQMINFDRRAKNAQKNEQINKLMQEILTEEERKLYELAKTSGRVEATMIVKDIDAIFDLLLNDLELEDRQEMIEECKLYFSYLKDIFAIKEEQNEVTPKVLYFKDENEIPYILKEVGDSKEIYKQIFGELNKIFAGNINDREVLGNNLPIKIWVKGHDFKIFYTKIQDVIVIITGFRKDNAYQQIRNIVQSKAFLNYLKKMKTTIQSGNIPDDGRYTEMLMAELKKSGAVRKK